MNSANTKLYTLLIVIAGLALGYLYYSNVTEEITIPAAPISNADNLKSFQNMVIDFSILDNPTYRALGINGEIPVNPGITGKRDIFAP
ncbi:hypothetical protein KW791_01745 [Candidatus Parcubacteria bacterium]|nr:hypothetical protein [Candidatus Parcubacteria bacterium]